MTTRNSLFALLVAAIPALAFTLQDVVFQLPDNQHEASLGLFVTVLGLLSVWVLGGRLCRSRHAHGSFGGQSGRSQRIPKAKLFCASVSRCDVFGV